MKKKSMTVVLSLVLVLCLAVGGTLAWLTAKTDTVTNTFTVGDINLELYEHVLQADGTLGETTTNSGNDNYKMVPGNTLPKDPTVVVKANSEACWLFVKVEKSANFDTYMSYTVDSQWTALAGNEGVFYKEVAANTADQEFNVLADKKVVVKDDVTKDMLETAKTSQPTIKFTAYAVQKDNVTSASDAWTKAKV